MPLMLTCALIISLVCGGESLATAKPNVLFISVDDLNHWVGYLGRNPQTKTPNIDRLAARGVRFTRSYCTAPLCNPSRTSLMTGLRPSSTGIYQNNHDWRPSLGTEKTLLTAFRSAGYDVLGAGKIYHNPFDRKSEWDERFFPNNDPRKTDEGVGGAGGIAFGPLQCSDQEMGDWKNVDWCIEQLQKPRTKPFFLACGHILPHMPWGTPQKYFDMFPLDTIKTPPFKLDDLADVPQAGIRMDKPKGDHAAVVNAGKWKHAIQAYLAAIAFTDMNLGRLLDALDKSPQRDNTVIVFWSDHGWHLGEKSHWRKFALWEEATRSPLVVIAPGVTKENTVCERTVDLVSVFPTLVDLCGLNRPPHLEGPSLLPLLRDPKAPWDHPAITTYGPNNHAIRTERWRYICYADGTEELYDHTNDPYEWTNLAQQAEMAQTKAALRQHLPKVNLPGITNAAGDRNRARNKKAAKKKGREG